VLICAVAGYDQRRDAHIHETTPAA